MYKRLDWFGFNLLFFFVGESIFNILDHFAKEIAYQVAL